MKTQREDAESAKDERATDRDHFAFSASSRLCVRFYDAVIRSRGMVCSVERKPMILFVWIFFST